MDKRIYIVNGKPRSGKDTFYDILKTMVPTRKCSAVDKVKDIAELCGWNGGKTEKDRKFLSDLKILTADYSDMPFTDVMKAVWNFRNDSTYQVLLIDIRESEEIERAKVAFKAKTIFIVNDRAPEVISNMADANVEKYTYDYYIRNNGTLDEYKTNICTFAKIEGLDIKC